MDGGGFDDLIVGADGNDEGGNIAGAGYVLFGGDFTQRFAPFDDAAHDGPFAHGFDFFGDVGGVGAGDDGIQPRDFGPCFEVALDGRVKPLAAGRTSALCLAPRREGQQVRCR